jgi:hypothetical protein
MAGGTPRRGWRALGIVAIVAFLLIDIALVYLALTHGRAGLAAGVGGSVISTPPPSPTPSDGEAPRPVEEPGEEEPPAGIELPALSRLLAPASATVAWRTLTGNCDSPVVVQRTDDGGASWVEFPVEAEGARSVLAISAIDDVALLAIAGVGEDCEPVRRESFSGGEFWQPSTRAAVLWHVAPGEPGAVVGPSGAVRSPCQTVSSLATRSSEEAAVSCSDGSVSLTADAGATWRGAGSDVVAVAADASGYTVARVGAEGCDGVQIAVLAPDRSAPRACVPVASTETVALAAGGGALWLWAGNEILVSSDRGVTWDSSSR